MKTRSQIREASAKSSPKRSMLSLKSRTINRFKQNKKLSAASSGKSSPTSLSKLVFTPLALPSNSRPSTPSRYFNAKTGTMMIVKKPQFKHLSLYRALLRSMTATPLRYGSMIQRDPSMSIANQTAGMLAC